MLMKLYVHCQSSFGVVEDDDEVIRATNTGEPVALQPSGKAALAYRNIARRLLGEKCTITSI